MQNVKLIKKIKELEMNSIKLWSKFNKLQSKLKKNSDLLYLLVQSDSESSSSGYNSY